MVEEERDGRHSRWDDHREQRRRLILDAAIEVVEAQPSGAELRLQDVAARAGLVRTVVQRHFGGQVGLLRAVQADVLRQAFELITAPLDFSGSMHDIAAQVVGTTIAWVEAHPALHALVEREVGDRAPSELALATAAYADFLAAAGAQLAGLFDILLTQRQADELRLLFIGVVGQVRATIAGWAAEQPRRFPADHLQELLATWVSVQVTTQAASFGLALEPTTPIARLATARD